MEFGSRTTGLHPGPPLETLIFRTKCHLLVWAKIKRKVTGITSCAYSLEHILLGGKKRCFCLGFAGKKESSVRFILIWNKPHSEFSDPGEKKKKALVSGESKWIPGSNQEKNAWGIRRTLWCRINFWWGFSLQHCPEFYAKHQGTLVNWTVTWVIVGLRPYSNDEVRGKKHTGLLSEEERKWRKKRFVEWARGWRKEFVSGRMMIHSEKIKHPFPLQRRGQNLV